MTDPSFASGTVWTGDNLPVMRGMNDACIDLIYVDPPFNSNRNYEAPIGSKTAGAAFKDAWTLNDVDVHEHGELAERSPAAYAVIEAARQAHGKGMQAYLIFMAVRLLEMRRVLKPDGSIYLHCDNTRGALAPGAHGRRVQCGRVPERDRLEADRQSQRCRPVRTHRRPAAVLRFRHRAGGDSPPFVKRYPARAGTRAASGVGRFTPAKFRARSRCPYWCTDCRSYFSVRTGTPLARVERPDAEMGHRDLPVLDKPQVGFVDEAVPRHRREATDRMVHAPAYPRSLGGGRRRETLTAR